jgi:hypothetical protein
VSTTLSYGYKKPQDGDKGSTFWDDLEFDIQRLNDHSHNGTDSALLASGNVTATTQAILAAGWVSQGGGLYRQLVTMPVLPTAMTFDNYWIVARDTTTKAQIYAAIEKVSATTFYIYINDNSKDLTLYYLS